MGKSCRYQQCELRYKAKRAVTHEAAKGRVHGAEDVPSHPHCFRVLPSAARLPYAKRPRLRVTPRTALYNVPWQTRDFLSIRTRPPLPVQSYQTANHKHTARRPAMTRNSTKTILILLATLSANAAAQTWTQLANAPFPQPTPTSSRYGGGAAFSLGNAGVLLYGGLQSGVTAAMDDTWLFDGTTYTQLAPPTTPPARWGHQMVYDSLRARVITFGGRSPTVTAVANDTWEFDGLNWIQILTPVSATARAFYAMAFDSRRGKAVMYGSQSGAGAQAQQTWEYDGSTWAQAATATIPPGIESPGMTFDKGRGVTVMFGGYNGLSPGTDYRTTYEFDGTNWYLRTTANAPATGYRTSMVYDDLHGRALLYGGYTGGVMQRIVWQYDGTNWTQALANAGPTRGTLGYAAYDTLRNQFYYIAGSGPGGAPNETYIYAGRSTALAGPYGRGCAGNAGTPSLVATSLPVLASTYTLDAGNLSGAVCPLFVLHGFSNSQSAFGPLPYNLAPIGFGGCSLETSADLALFTLGFGGTATSTIAIPSTPNFLDLQLWSQVLTLDSAAPNGNGAISNGIHAVLGY